MCYVRVPICLICFLVGVMHSSSRHLHFAVTRISHSIKKTSARPRGFLLRVEPEVQPARLFIHSVTSPPPTDPLPCILFVFQVDSIVSEHPLIQVSPLKYVACRWSWIHASRCYTKYRKIIKTLCCLVSLSSYVTRYGCFNGGNISKLYSKTLN